MKATKPSSPTSSPNREGSLLRLLCLVSLLLLRPFNLPAFDIAEWVAKTDRDLNPILSEMILSEDSETALRLIKALGERRDPYVQDIIENIFFQYSDGVDEEYFLEALFDSVLSRRPSPDRLSGWVDENRGAVELLAAHLPHLSNAFLKAHVLTCIPHTGSPDAASRLMSEGASLLHEMRRSGGFLPPGRVKEVLALFAAARTVASPELLPLCLDLRSSSRQKMVVVDAGRAVRTLRDLVD